MRRSGRAGRSARIRSRRRGSTRREAEHAALIEGFRDACLASDIAELARLLGPEVRVVVDSGGAEGAPGPAAGITAAVTLLRVALGAPAGLRLDLRSVNGRPGLLASRDGRPTAVVVVEGRRGLVEGVWLVTDAGKLRHW